MAQKPRRRGRRRAVDGVFDRGRALPRLQGRDLASLFAEPEIRSRRHQQLGVDEHIPLFQFLIGIRHECDVPVGRRIANLRRSFHAPPSSRCPRRVQTPEFFVERADGLFLQNRDDRFQPRELGRMKIDGVAAGRERRVLETLEILPHVRDDRIDDVARVSPRRRRTENTHNLNRSG